MTKVYYLIRTHHSQYEINSVVLGLEFETSRRIASSKFINSFDVEVKARSVTKHAHARPEKARKQAMKNEVTLT